MKKTTIYFLVLICMTTLITNAQQKTPSKKIKVFLLAGQSNMDGRAKGGNISEEDQKRLKKAQQNVTLYYNFAEGKPLDVTKAFPYVVKTFDTKTIFGPELFFGIRMSEKYPEHKIILIKRSRGNMSLYGAWNPEWNEQNAILMKEGDQPKLYSEFVDYSKKVLSKLKPNSYDLCGILWVQGEADAVKIKTSKAPGIKYEENLEKLISYVRKDFNHPKLPFLLFQVGNGKVVEGMKNVAKKDDNVILIPQETDINSSFYFEQNPPPIWHYTAKSMKKMGEYFFEFYNKKYN